MSTRHARIADKELNDRHAKILTGLLSNNDNSCCADCRKKDPRWASWNLGIFICIHCSGIHRSLGTHISKVKSVDLDTWTPEQIENMTKWGNRRANMYWEATLQEKNRSENNMDAWIRAKYENKRWVQKQEQFESPKNAQEKELHGRDEPKRDEPKRDEPKKEEPRIEQPIAVECLKEKAVSQKISSDLNVNGVNKPNIDIDKLEHDRSGLGSSKMSLNDLQSQFSQLAASNAQSSNMIPKAPPGSDMSWTNFLVAEKPKDNNNILSEPSKEKPLLSFDALASLLKQ